MFKVSNKTPSFRDHVVQCTFLWGGKVLGFALSLKPLQQKVTVRKGSPKRQCHGEGSGRPGGQAEDRQSNQGNVGSWFPTCDLTGDLNRQNTILFVGKSASYCLGSVVRGNIV